MFLKPKDGLIVRDPVSKQALPADGKDVQSSGYWMRRLRDGDVEVAEAPKKTEADDVSHGE